MIRFVFGSFEAEINQKQLAESEFVGALLMCDTDLRTIEFPFNVHEKTARWICDYLSFTNRVPLCEKNPFELYQIAMVANYLGMKSLLSETCSIILIYICGFSVDVFDKECTRLSVK